VRLLADENFPGSAVGALIRSGHDVIWIRTAAPEMPDHEIFRWAVREGRVILTFDKDFGEIARRARVSGPCGIVLFRLPMSSAGQMRDKIIETIGSRSDWPGNFSVVEANRVRIKPMSELSL
jgi:predicted nuclease of predicted toxin-antitoxin system